jgi:hypothetical protein
MALVSVDQDALDQLAANLEAVKAALGSEISNLQSQANIPPGSLTGLNTALTDLQGLQTPPAAPAAPPAG